MAPDDEPPVTLRTKVAVGGALLGAFMSVLNIQVVNTSLPDIQGGIGSGLEDGGWISTAYLIGEIIVIPLSGWMSEVFSLRRYLIASTVAFLFFSVACGLSSTFPEMVSLRALQGFSGGVLIPLALVCVITLLPPRARPTGFALFALTATFAPAIGPTIGGAITDIYGWRYIFFLNLAPGVVMLAALVWGLDASPMRLERFWQGDWIGIAFMAVGLGSLQVVLEEGNKDDWFSSIFITRLSVISAVTLVLFLYWELRPANKEPLLNLRLFAARNFSFISICNLLLGFTLYAAVYMIPVYLAVVHGYSAREAGEVMLWIGLPQLAIIPFTPYLMRKFDARLLLGIGLALFSASAFMNMSLGPDDSGPQLFVPNIVRAFGQALVFAPITMLATAGIPLKDSASASSLFNMLRNLGGAFGIAVIETFVTNREKFHSAMITPQVSLLEPATRLRLTMLQHYFETHGTDPGVARRQAVILVGETIRRQANIMAYGDGFALLGTCMALATIVLFFVKKPPQAGGGPGAH